MQNKCIFSVQIQCTGESITKASAEKHPHTVRFWCMSPATMYRKTNSPTLHNAGLKMANPKN